jgi:hypothetical protein
MLQIVLTRYLYVKTAVIHSLRIAILQSHIEKALFWAYELYRSGFQTEVIQLLFSIYDKNESYSEYRNLRKCLQKKYEKWKLDYKANSNFIGTMILNMMYRNRGNWKDSSKILMIIFNDTVGHYETKTIGKPWQYLPKCCLYQVEVEDDYNGSSAANLFKTMKSQTEWLYHASFSPIWNMRLQKYNAKVDHVLKDIVFLTDDDFEKFMDKFGFEPDEQSLNLW